MTLKAPHIQTEIPGPKSRALVAEEQRHLAPGLQGFALSSGIAVERAQGEHVPQCPRRTLRHRHRNSGEGNANHRAEVRADGHGDGGPRAELHQNSREGERAVHRLALRQQAHGRIASGDLVRVNREQRTVRRRAERGDEHEEPGQRRGDHAPRAWRRSTRASRCS